MALPPGIERIEDDEDAPAASVSLPEGVERVTDPTPTFGDQARAFGQSAVRGFGESLPLIMGGVGAGLGAVAGAPTGPGALATGAAGLALGAGAGTAARGALFDFFDIPTIEDLPEELRPAGVAGEFVGGAIGGAGAPTALGRAGFRTGGRFLDRVLDTAARRPGTVIGAEASAATGGAVASGVAEEVAPGNIPARVGAGIAGSVLSPVGLTAFGTNAVAGAFNRVRTLTTRGGREAAAARDIQRVVAEAGENPEELARRMPELLRQLPSDASPTSAQLTGSRGLAAMESELVRRDPQFGRDAQKTAQQTLELMRRSADALSATGDPAALREAAELRRAYFSTLLADQVQAAEQRAVQAAERIGPTTPENVSEVSRRTAAILEESLKKARDVERSLYAKVPDMPAAPENILSTVDDIKANSLLPDESLPSLVESFSRRLNGAIEEGGDATVSSVKELRIFRSRMLDEARKASAAGDASQARIFGKLAEAALDDLDAVTDTGGPLDVARQFSRSLNDVYTRSFAGQASATTQTGAARTAPELLLRRAAGTGQEVGALRMGELNRAAQLTDPDGNLVAPEAFDDIMQLQEQFLRNAAESVVDQNGQVSLRRLATFKRRNAEMLEQFPELRTQLESAESAQNALGEVAKRTKAAGQVIDKRAAFARVAQAENPTLAVSRILSGSRPQEEFRQLAVLARRDGPDAVAGLQRTVLDDAMQRAGGGTENFSFEKFTRLLTEPRRAGQPSALQLMQRNGVLSADETKRLETILQQGLRVESAAGSRESVDNLLEGESALFDLIARVGGVRIGGGVFRALGGEGPGAIVAAGRGSAYAQQVLEKIPAGRVQDVIIEAAKDPVLMQKLLAKPQSLRERLQLGRELNALLLQRGITLSGAAAAGVDDER